MNLPLIFRFRQLVLGNGFIAGVRMTGRAILEEGEETWITGVAPAGFAGGGVDRNAAFVDFRRGWAEILFEIAAEAASFEELKANCEAFLQASTTELDKDWQAALAQARASGYTDRSLPSVQAEAQPVTYDVCELEPHRSSAEENEVEVVQQVAA